jgi:hypothetical protein
MEVLNDAIQGLPPERIRYHVCWGSWPGPHVSDVPLKDIADLILSVKVGAYVIEGANPRHEHEWVVWKDVKMPEGRLLIPGVISHATNSRACSVARMSSPGPTVASRKARSIAGSTRRSCGPSSKHWSRGRDSPARSCGAERPGACAEPAT